MRWKIVFLKKPALASETIEAEAFGALFRSSLTVKLPQLVSKVSVQVFEAASGAVGFLAPPSGFGFGASTCLQPPEAGAAASVGAVGVAPPAGMSAVLPPLLEPQAVSAVAASSATSVATNLMRRPRLAFNRRGDLSLPPQLRTGDPRPGRLRVARGRAGSGGGGRERGGAGGG